jgi:hypothetical protein
MLGWLLSRRSRSEIRRWCDAVTLLGNAAIAGRIAGLTTSGALTSTPRLPLAMYYLFGDHHCVRSGLGAVCSAPSPYPDYNGIHHALDLD